MADVEAAGPAIPDSLHIVSWNVAGWIKTIEFIRRHHSSLQVWMDRHAIDILCLQEVKGTSSRLEGDPSLFDARIPGFDTFWALCNGSGPTKVSKGFNGVATLVRQRPGAPRVTANPAVLGVPELDEEGRCLMTDHGNFAVFNVYVPNSGSGSSRLPYKIRFLSALRERMSEARASGKMVVLAGDLNIRARCVDTAPSMRILNLDLIRLSSSEELRHVREIVRDVWPKVEKSLSECLTKAVTTTKANKDKVVKYRRVARTLSNSSTMAALGDLHESELSAKYSYYLGFRLVNDGESSAVARRRNEICLYDFEEILRMVGGVKLEAEDITALEKHARPCESPACLDWLHTLQLDDGMVDTFAARHPLARRRATCWEQYRARRYENAGTRIDYLFVDEALYDLLPKQNPPLQTGKVGKDGSMAPIYSEEAALLSCTANGLWKPPSFEGGGLVDGTSAAYDHQFYRPHFGMIYTPPQLSDHIAVSALLPLPTAGPPCGLCTSRTTRSAQPHLAQATIMQSFTLGGASLRKRAASTEIDRELEAPPPTSGPLCHQCHFRVCKCTLKGSKKRKKQQGKASAPTLLSFVARKSGH